MSYRARGRGGRSQLRNFQPRGPRLTHFISLPLGHIPALREKVSEFSNALIDQQHSIAGLDPSIVISPRRLHLTLGVLSLDDTTRTFNSGQTADPNAKTTSRALELLRTIQPTVLLLMGSKPLRVPLDTLDIMPPEGGNPERAHVMWVGPSLLTPEGRMLKNVCDFIHRQFISAGLVQDEGRPLKLHCTLINTTYRRPRGHKTPFSFPSILATEAYQKISKPSTGTVTSNSWADPPYAAGWSAEVDWLAPSVALGWPAIPASPAPPPAIRGSLRGRARGMPPGRGSGRGSSGHVFTPSFVNTPSTMVGNASDGPIPTSFRGRGRGRGGHPSFINTSPSMVGNASGGPVPTSSFTPAPAPTSFASNLGPFPVDLGSWYVTEIQLCEMGSWGPEGEYVSVGGVSLRV